MLLIVEVVIALWVHDEIIRPYIGDILVVILIYFVVHTVSSKNIRLLPMFIFIFAASVELFQYFKIVEILGLENNMFARVIIGSTFDIKDIICYGVGCLLLLIFQNKPV
jgi:hypothetical protein